MAWAVTTEREVNKSGKIRSEVAVCMCVSVCLSFYRWLIVQAGDAYGLGSDHRGRSVIVLVKYEKSLYMYVWYLQYWALFDGLSNWAQWACTCHFLYT